MKKNAPRLSFAEAMSALEGAGTEQNRKTWSRHGVSAPMFGVSFATLKTLRKRIGVDHELAVALWDSGNYDARNLAVKVADPARLSPEDLDRWAEETTSTRPCGPYVAMLVAEGPHAAAKAAQWIGAGAPAVRKVGWSLLGRRRLRHPRRLVQGPPRHDRAEHPHRAQPDAPRRDPRRHAQRGAQAARHGDGSPDRQGGD